MLEILLDLVMFFFKSLIIVVSILVVVGFIISLRSGKKTSENGSIHITNLTKDLQDQFQGLTEELLGKKGYKLWKKQEKNKDKKEQKASKKKPSKSNEISTIKEPKVFVIDFDGDIKASQSKNLSEEITAIVQVATNKDEVVLRLESPGGMVHGYGLASSQLQRLQDHKIPLTICVDKVAASGGYMMACMGSKIIAAPFAVVGSIGVIAQIPNFNKLLKKWNVDYEQHTSGKFKRTLTMLGENTAEGRKKFRQELDSTHGLFKELVKSQRPSLSITKVATGETWYGKQAVDLNLIDEISTSDEYLYKLSKSKPVYHLSYKIKKSLPEKLGIGASALLENIATSLLQKNQEQETSKS